MAIEEFCGCYDLKEGFKAFAFILLMLRLLSFAIVPGTYLLINSGGVVLAFCILYVFWNLGSTIILLFALRGVYRNNADLLFPNVVILPMEIIFTIAAGVIIPIVTGQGFFALYLLVCIVHVYHFLCVHSLYRKFKKQEPGNDHNLLGAII